MKIKDFKGHKDWWPFINEQYNKASEGELNEGGNKLDEGKTRYDLLPPEALEQVARVLTFGAKKYTAYNWAKGISYSRLFGAAMRHLWAWWGGEDRDPETGLSHLAHAGCCIFFLLAFIERGREDLDDRHRVEK